MTDHAGLLRQIRTDARPYIEQALDLAETFTGFRKLASENGLDWGVIKALIKAEIQDEKEGGSLKVDRIIEKADFASAYADMLGLRTANMNEEKITSAVPTVVHEDDAGKPSASFLTRWESVIKSGVVLTEDLPPAETASPPADIQGSGPPAEGNGPLPSPIVSPPPQTIAAVVASTSRDAPAASPFPEIPKFLERRIA